MSLNGAAGVFELVLHDGTRVPVLDGMTIGRAPGNTLQLDDPSVSRHHARITLGDPSGAPLLEDAGSSYGTRLDGSRVDGVRRLGDGSHITLGDEELLVERRRGAAEAGRTIVVPPGDSLILPASGAAAALAPAATGFGEHPRLRSGYALKRLEVAEGPRRWVLNDLRTGKFLHLSDEDAGLLQLLDGRRERTELIQEAEQRFGAAGPARLARLLAGLGDRGLLAGGDSATAPPNQPQRGIDRLLRAREATWTGAGKLFDELYARGGWLLFTRPAKSVFPLLAALGIIIFGYLVVGRYGTPFVVAHKIGLGGLVFVVGRFAVVAFHETAHGLAMASFGRHVRKAGVKLMLVFPYAYVDTSEIWFEPRRRRIAVSAAGPVSDLVLGAVFSLCCLALAAGTVRDIFFQLAFGAYLGALFNLNPTLERDGYNILVDVLREPGLRRRAREQLRARLSGRFHGSSSPALMRYALLSLVWTAVAAIFVAALSLRYLKPLTAVAPRPVAWTFLAVLWLALFVPVLGMIGPPLRQRLRSRTA
ncbi:MAG: putative peptide zinc metalloprotease protein [Actinomycetota bacterium]